MECSGSTTVNYKSLDYDREYYIGVKDSSVLLVSEKVATSQLVSGDLDLTSDGLAYSAYLYGNVSGKLWLYEEASGRYIESIDIAYPEDIIMGTFNDWEYGHTYSLLAILESPSFSKTLDDITIPFPETSLTASATGDTINYTITSSISLVGYAVYLIPPDSSDFTYTVISNSMYHDEKYWGSFGVMNAGTYRLYLNEAGLDNPALNSYASAQIDVIYATLELGTDGKIHYSITFSSEISAVDFYLKENDLQVQDGTEYDTTSITGHYDHWIAGATYLLRVAISGQSGVDLKTLTIDFPEDLQTLVSSDTSFNFVDDKLVYNLALTTRVAGTVQIVDESNDPIVSREFRGNNDAGDSDNWVRGKTYTLRLIIGETAINVESENIPNPVSNLTAAYSESTVTFTVTENSSGSIIGLGVYLLNSENDTLVDGKYTTIDSVSGGKSQGSFSGVAVGLYTVVINESEMSSGYRQHEYASADIRPNIVGMLSYSDSAFSYTVYVNGNYNGNIVLEKEGTQGWQQVLVSNFSEGVYANSYVLTGDLVGDYRLLAVINNTLTMELASRSIR